MSGWNEYVYDMMKDTGYFDAAIILAKDSLSIWASTEEFEEGAVQEVAELLDRISGDKRNPASITLAGINYKPILIEENRLYAVKESNINAGLLVRIGIQCVIIGTYPPSVQPGLAVDTLERLAVYLGEQGF